MTNTEACTGTEFLTAEQTTQRAAELGVYAPRYGRRMCTACDGLVLINTNGKLRKHKVGSNLTRLPGA